MTPEFLSEYFLFIAVLLIIYFFECIVKIPPNSIVFDPHFGTGWKIKSSLLANNKGGFSFVSPFPPLTPAFMAHLPIAIFSPTRIFFHLFPAPGFPYPGEPSAFTYSDIISSELSGRKIIINKEHSIEFPGERYAEWVHGLIQELRTLNERDRAAKVRTILKQILDVDGARYLIRYYKNKTKMLQVICNLLLIYIVFFLPFIVFFGYSFMTVYVICGMLILQLPVLILYHRYHKRFFPGLSGDRIVDLAAMMLCPPAAVRAYANLGRPLLSSYDPLVPAFLLCDPQTATEFARRTVRGILFPARDSSDSPGSSEAAEITLKAYERIFAEHRIDIPELLCAPEMQENCSAYCPRCENQFSANKGRCPDCGTGLVDFPDSGGTEITHREEMKLQ